MIIVLIAVKPDRIVIREGLRILPDLIRLLKRLATDPGQPVGVRVRLGLLMAYLAFPIDLVPDFIPLLGYADDVIIVIAVLRSDGDPDQQFGPPRHRLHRAFVGAGRLPDGVESPGQPSQGAEAAGFEPARGDEPSTRLAGGRHRPD